MPKDCRKRLPKWNRGNDSIEPTLLVHQTGQQTRLDWTGLRTGLVWTGLDWKGLDWTGKDWTGLDWTGLDWTGLDWTGLDWTGLDWTETGVSLSGLIWTIQFWGWQTRPLAKGKNRALCSQFCLGSNFFSNSARYNTTWHSLCCEIPLTMCVQLYRGVLKWIS